MYPTAEETALWKNLNLAQRSVYRVMDTALKAKGLPPLRWYDVLWAIERADRQGLRPRDVERSLLFEQSNLSRLLRRMISEGLVAESVFKDDRRGKMLRVTQKGRRIRRQMWKVYGPMIHKYMSLCPKGPGPGRIASSLDQLIER